MQNFDVIVVGGGPAGYNSAEYAAHHGKKVLLVEKKSLGGTCLNVGCIPTKTFLYAGKMYHYASVPSLESPVCRVSKIPSNTLLRAGLMLRENAESASRTLEISKSLPFLTHVENRLS